MPGPVAARSKAWVYNRSPAETVGSNPTGGMLVCCECCVLSGRGLSNGNDYSSRGVLPTVARRCLWTRNLENEEAKARYRAVKIQPQWVVTPGKQTISSILLYTTTCFGCPDRPSSGICQIYNKKYKVNRTLFAHGYELYQYYSKNGIIRLKLMHNHVKEFLRYDLHGNVKKCDKNKAKW